MTNNSQAPASTTSISPSYVDDRFPGPDPYAPLGNPPALKVWSDDFANGDKIPAEFTGTGPNPHLAWGDLPEGTKSIAITCYDPDAPTAAGFWHWAVANIDTSVTEVPRGAADEVLAHALTLKGDNGTARYYGPQPPAGHGPHRYLFAVHALDVEKLDLDPSATPTVLGFNLYFHTLARGIHWGWYENA